MAEILPIRRKTLYNNQSINKKSQHFRDLGFPVYFNENVS